MANYSGRKCWMVKCLQTNRSDEHEQAFKCNVVHRIKLTMRHHQESANTKARIEWKIVKQWINRESIFVPLLWLTCDVHQWIGLGLLFMSLTQKPVHRHAPYETRGLYAAENITDGSMDLLNDARRPAADGPDRRTYSTSWSTNACARAQRRKPTLWWYISLTKCEM